MNLRRAALYAGPLLAALVWWGFPDPRLSPDGRHALALTLLAVLWWASGAVAPVWTTMTLLLGYVALGVAGPETVFRFLTTPLFWLMWSAFLLVAAMTQSGLARRIAGALLRRWRGGYTGLVLLAYAASLLLSPLVPIPFPRSLLVMAVFDAVLHRAQATASQRAAVGFAVFTSATATSAALLTGDAVLNGAALQIAGAQLTWLQWALHMAVPSLLMAGMMLLAHLALFRPGERIRPEGPVEPETLSPMSPAEWRTLLTMSLALLLWATDAFHSLHPAWAGMAAVLALALPVGGKPVLTVDDLVQRANWPILLYVTGAASIGAVAAQTGLAAYLGERLLPAAAPQHPMLLGLILGGVTMVGHLFLGSSLSTLAVMLPVLAGFGTAGGWPLEAVALTVYSAVAMQYILPFQAVPVLVGAGEAGGYGHKETLRFALPLTLLALLLVSVIQPLWWQWTGLLSR
ncbi:MAG: SLC13 family permease [Bacillota bacterium]